MAERIAQLRVNLERIRWLPRKVAARRVVVNIADFRTTLYVDDRAVLSERVATGARTAVNRRSRSEFVSTKMLDTLIAAAAIAGSSSQPVNG